MNTQVTQAQIDFYRENGFVVLDNFLTAEELEIWRAAVDGATQKRGQQRMANQDWKVDEESYYSKVFVQRVNLWQDNEPIRKLIVDSRLGKLAATLNGVDGVRLWHDQA